MAPIAMIILATVLYLQISAYSIDTSTVSNPCSNNHSPGRPEQKCIGKFHDYATIEWLVVGEKALDPIEFIMGLWDSVSIHVISETTFIVWAYGGTEIEPQARQGWNRKYCWGHGIKSLWDTLSGASQCTFSVPRYSVWGPYGKSTIGIQPSSGFLVQHASTTVNTTYIVEYQTVFDNSYPIYFISGILIFLISPYLSHSNLFYTSLSTLLGGVGSFIILLYIISRVLPGERKGRMLTGMVSISAVVLQFFWTTFKKLMIEYVYFVAIVILIGAFAGFSLAYTHPLKSERTMNLLEILLRILSCLFLLSGTNSVFISITILLILIFLQKFYPYICLNQYQQENDLNACFVNNYNTKVQHVGSNSYMDKSVAQKVMEKTTEKELDELVKMYANRPDLVSKLSSTAQKRVATAVTEYKSREWDAEKDPSIQNMRSQCICC